MTASPVTPVSFVPPAHRLWSPMPEAPAASAQQATSFAAMMTDAIDHVSTNVTQADALVRSFVLDDSIPVHQVTYALEQARLSMELMLQVRSRLLETYQQLMGMQL